MSLKLDLISDTHIAHWKNKPIDWVGLKNPDSTILVLPGDIGHYENDVYRTLYEVENLYDYIVLTDGNHEFYATKEQVSPFTKKMQKYIKKNFNNVTYLNGANHFQIHNTAFIGANGWYDWIALEDMFSYEQSRRAWKHGLNDYKYVQFDDNNQEYGPDVLAEKQFKQLKAKVKKFQTDSTIDNIVVVTHTVPKKELLIIKNSYTWDSLTPSFCNTQMASLVNHDKQKKIKAYLFGHTHARQHQVIDGIQYAINARGYPNELGPCKLTQIEII